jgi:hypothetical protein
VPRRVLSRRSQPSRTPVATTSVVPRIDVLVNCTKHGLIAEWQGAIALQVEQSCLLSPITRTPPPVEVQLLNASGIRAADV